MGSAASKRSGWRSVSASETSPPIESAPGDGASWRAEALREGIEHLDLVARCFLERPARARVGRGGQRIALFGEQPVVQVARCRGGWRLARHGGCNRGCRAAACRSSSAGRSIAQGAPPAWLPSMRSAASAMPAVSAQSARPESRQPKRHDSVSPRPEDAANRRTHLTRFASACKLLAAHIHYFNGGTHGQICSNKSFAFTCQCIGPVRLAAAGSGAGRSRQAPVPGPPWRNCVTTCPRTRSIARRSCPTAPLPLFVWGNGACRDNGLAHAAFLRQIASQGYFVVSLGKPREERPFNPNPQPPAPPAAPAAGATPGAPPRNTPDETQAAQMLEAIDWATRENARAGGEFAGPHRPVAHRRGRPQLRRPAGAGGLARSAHRHDLVLNSGIYVRTDRRAQRREHRQVAAGQAARTDALPRLAARRTSRTRTPRTTWRASATCRCSAPRCRWAMAARSGRSAMAASGRASRHAGSTSR